MNFLPELQTSVLPAASEAEGRRQGGPSRQEPPGGGSLCIAMPPRPGAGHGRRWLGSGLQAFSRSRKFLLSKHKSKLSRVVPRPGFKANTKGYCEVGVLPCR